MFKLLVLAVLIAACQAGGYSSSYFMRRSGYGGASSASSGGGYGGAAGGSYGGGPITAAVQTRHSVEIKPVAVKSDAIQPQVIEVDASVLPLTILFRSASSNVKVLQQHQGAAGETQQTSSEDEPHKLVHQVTKPIYQEVREIITPYRKIIQEIRPVQEEIQTIVAKGEKRASGGYGGFSGVSSGGYGGGLAVSKSSGGAGGLY